MNDNEQISILKKGVRVWNKWRRENPDVKIDLTGIDLTGLGLKETRRDELNPHESGFTTFPGVDLSKINLKGANLRDANLRSAYLKDADLSSANLRAINLSGALLINTNLRDADLRFANLNGSRLYKTNFIDANLKGAKLEHASADSADFYSAELSYANLMHAALWNCSLRSTILCNSLLIDTDLRGSDLSDADLGGADLRKAILNEVSLLGAKILGGTATGAFIYGINVWDVEGEFQEQKDLVITRFGTSPAITVDNIKVAQFIYLILNNAEIRDVINILTSKSVLILGRFALSERRIILDALKDKLREYNLLPIVFDFDRPTDKDFTETIKTLAGLCYFVIADVTNPKSSPLELQATVPDYQIPFVPIIQEGESPFSMMVDLQKKYNWVLNTVSFDSKETLMKVLKPLIIDPAMKKRQELRIVKAQEPEIISAKEFLAKGKA